MEYNELITITEYKKKLFQAPSPILTHWPGFDSASGGFFKGELTIFGGRPTTGKTDLLMRLALWLEQSGKKVIFLTPKQDMNLIVSKFDNLKAKSDVVFGDIFKPSENELIHLCLKPRIYVEQIDDIINKNDHFSDDCILMVDNFASLETEQEFQKEHYKMQYLMQELKRCATENNIPVIATVGMNRKADGRMGMKIPFLCDLRGSGEIEEIADKVGLIYRPEYYGITEFDDGESAKNITEIIFTKNSYGKLGSFTFDNHFTNGDQPEYNFNELLKS